MSHPPCPRCSFAYPYEQDNLLICSECNHQWDPQQQEPVVVTNDERGEVVKDAHGVILQDGDSVVIVKDLKVKGASGALKVGTKVRNIRLVEGDHNIDCNIPGFGGMKLKSEFVKKAE